MKIFYRGKTGSPLNHKTKVLEVYNELFIFKVPKAW